MLSTQCFEPDDNAVLNRQLAIIMMFKMVIIM